MINLVRDICRPDDHECLETIHHSCRLKLANSCALPGGNKHLITSVLAVLH